MRPAESYEDLKTLRLWSSEGYSKKYAKPLNIPKDKLFDIMRESDIEDTRKVLVLVPYLFPQHRFNGKSKIYWGMEDAVRTLYRDGCKFYMSSDMVQMKYPSGFRVEFHRLEYLRECDEDKVCIATYLRVVREGYISRNRTKVKLKWKNKYGKYSN